MLQSISTTVGGVIDPASLDETCPRVSIRVRSSIVVSPSVAADVKVEYFEGRQCRLRETTFQILTIFGTLPVSVYKATKFVFRSYAASAQHLAKGIGDDAAGLAARQAAGDCSFWKRVIKGTMCFAAGTKVHLSSLPDASATATPFELSVDGPLQPSAVKAKTDQSLLVPIEDVPLGATVDAQNPDGTGFDAVRGVASDWQRIELVMHRSDGAILEAELLRHRSETKLLEVGQWYELATDEEELSGWAQIIAIDDNVQLGDGEGNLVVSRFKTIANKEVVRVTLENGEEIVGTPGHRTWCVNRKEFIGLAEFEYGELVETLDGNVPVVYVENGIETENVFNIEVAGQHVYRVSQLGLLVHNNGSCDDIANNATKIGVNQVPITIAAKSSWPRISAVAPDWATKGAHIHINGVELAVRPGNNASIVLKAVFSSTSNSAFKSASKSATKALKDIGFRQRLHNSAVRALQNIGGDTGKAAELRFLIAALQKLGV